MRVLLPLGLSLLSLLAACTGTTVAGTGGGSTGGSTSGGDGGACIDPTVGQACTSAEVACEPSDPCCTTGYVWSCDTTTGTWQQEGLGCACPAAPMPFSCGTTECVPGQYCEAYTPGTAPPDGGGPTYTCLTIPSQCTASPTCGCIQSAIEGAHPECSSTQGTCVDQGAFGITLDCHGV
jgi:hypothetical protein